MAETQSFSRGVVPCFVKKSDNLTEEPNSPQQEHRGHDRLNLKLEVKAGGEPGMFEGYGAVFGNRDNDNDIVLKGAFADSLRARTPAMLWQHNMREPIGRFLDVREDEKGLYVRGKLSMKGRGAEAYELLSMGALDGLSIGFVTKEATRDAATGTRTIHKADLMEISLVTFPANEMARVESVKADAATHGDAAMSGDAIMDERAFERFLRASGFSRNRAKTITAKGFKADMNAHKKGNMMPYDEQDIADIVNDLEFKRDYLLDYSSDVFERKQRLPKGPHAALIEETIRNIISAYRSIRPTPQPIHMLRGETSQFRLALNFDKTGKVKIIPGGKGIHMFECEVVYWKWTKNGPKRSKLKLFQRRSAARLTEVYHAGKVKDLREWLGSFRTVSQVESAISRVNQVINTLAPRGTITYKGPHLRDPIPDMEHSEIDFRILGL
ncbi:HK97 family phage prohead protease [Kordiimonas sp. SCSIO 12610]|uniref:HK97 family phage prohead protease n=1 Tax=Kordiimonas sp. SCSIO 12610 TaxID=2829597 RepID=UPI00210C574E|nr:HK97 family phage prohead protease [Kordiimonas sp. SCSIO 12610]UTW56174.1 HK97 family phage prohead protease [Kordiimonas sp. SCSIO 12610]